MTQPTQGVLLPYSCLHNHTHTCTHSPIHAHTCIHIHAYTHMHILKYVHTYIHKHTWTHMCTHTHTSMHAHKLQFFKSSASSAVCCVIKLPWVIQDPVLGAAWISPRATGFFRKQNEQVTTLAHRFTKFW